MNHLDTKFNRRLGWIVVGSLLFFAVVTVFRVGIGALPYDATDSAGHPSGFNDPLYPQHYLMMVERFQISGFFSPKHTYAWVLLGVQLAGLGLLLGGPRDPAWLTRWFFALQPIVFFWGIPALPFLLFAVVASFGPAGGFDREFWIDNPEVIVMLTAPVWVLASLLVLWKARGEWLGLRRLLKWVWARVWRRSPAKRKPLGAENVEGLSVSPAGI